ncbi:hypothetical protein PSTEL_00840 [Paenibacillus stellifer]|uniref:Uncharacterized protein n=1 Tax=Paenibacillus stellifer TaxID=169760 RepID=A0A089LM13_9BACL|nr:hypothetical protein PSTEL_00840 [Paenibacillus stellifer]
MVAIPSPQYTDLNTTLSNRFILSSRGILPLISFPMFLRLPPGSLVQLFVQPIIIFHEEIAGHGEKRIMKGAVALQTPQQDMGGSVIDVVRGRCRLKDKDRSP